MGVSDQPWIGVDDTHRGVRPSTSHSPNKPASTMEISQVFLLISGISFSLALPSPATGVLRSEYPEEPIENPAEWAWGQHPRNGLGYKAKDNLELEVCLANPHMIATAKCKIPLDLCLENPEWLPLVGCSGEGYPRQVCLDFPNLITSPACQAHHSVFGAFSLEICLRFPTLLPKPACQAALDGYDATLFDCQDNKEFFCSRNMCEKHQFIVKC